MVTHARGATRTYSYNGRHLVTGIIYDVPAGVAATANVSYAYDASGNLTNDGGQWFAYDAQGRQTYASINNLQQAYDGDGLRGQKTDNGQTIYYLRSSVLGSHVVNPKMRQTVKDRQVA